MIKKSPGSIMILFFMITSAILIVSLSCWYKMSLLADLLTERERSYQNYYLTEIFFTEAINFVQQSFDLFNDQKIASQFPLTFFIQTPPFFQEKMVTGKLTVSHYLAQPLTLLIIVETYHKEKILFTIRGLLSKNFHPGNNHGQKKSLYELHHVTFGASF